MSLRKARTESPLDLLDKIPLVIDILITAVRNGELDAQLAQVKKPTAALKTLKVA